MPSMRCISASVRSKSYTFIFSYILCSLVVLGFTVYMQQREDGSIRPSSTCACAYKCCGSPMHALTHTWPRCSAQRRTTCAGVRRFAAAISLATVLSRMGLAPLVCASHWPPSVLYPWYCTLCLRQKACASLSCSRQKREDA
jgi:hypothetical protein